MTNTGDQLSAYTRFGARPLWPLLAGGTGGLLWVQTAFGAAAELLVGTPTLAHTAACTLAALALLAGLALRRADILLALFPFTILVSVSTMPADVENAAMSALRFIPWLVSFLVFALASSTWLSRPDEEADGVTRAPATSAPAPSAQRITALRLTAAAALLLVPAAALVLSEPAAHFSAGAVPRLTFAHTALTFLWCLALYSFFVSPMLDAERHRRQSERKARSERDAPSRAAARLRGALTVLAILACFILLLLSQR